VLLFIHTDNFGLTCFVVPEYSQVGGCCRVMGKIKIYCALSLFGGFLSLISVFIPSSFMCDYDTVLDIANLPNPTNYPPLQIMPMV
jgi:hypothetical protein